MPTLRQSAEPAPEAPKSGAKAKAFITGMIIAVSALAGGFAVVLWNRKVLSGLHAESRKKPPTSPDEDEA